MNEFQDGETIQGASVVRESDLVGNARTGFFRGVPGYNGDIHVTWASSWLHPGGQSYLTSFWGHSIGSRYINYTYWTSIGPHISSTLNLPGITIEGRVTKDVETICSENDIPAGLSGRVVPYKTDIWVESVQPTPLVGFCTSEASSYVSIPLAAVLAAAETSAFYISDTLASSYGVGDDITSYCTDSASHCVLPVPSSRSCDNDAVMVYSTGSTYHVVGFTRTGMSEDYAK